MSEQENFSTWLKKEGNPCMCYLCRNEVKAVYDEEHRAKVMITALESNEGKQ